MREILVSRPLRSSPARLAMILCISSALSFGMAGCGKAASGAGTGSTTPPAVSVSVSGSASTRLGATTQFTAAVVNATNTAVTWQVNSVTGGSAATGTISSTGLYTAPATIPAAGSVTIAAISTASPAASGTLAEAIWNPQPTVSAATATPTATANSYLVDVQGAGFVSGSDIQSSGSSVTTVFVSSTELQATVAVPTGTTSVTLDVTNPVPGASTSPNVTATITPNQTSVVSAARLLDQATFGPTVADIANVQKVGLQGYLNQQFALPVTTLPDISNPPPAQCVNSTRPCAESEWWQTVLTAPDQLRQRVAFALSEMFVISTNSVNPRAVTPYQNMLANDAFGNFETLMKDVSLSPGMGAYLNMLNSNKPAPGQIANENYPRELMQLFTTGIDMINPDGTLQHDGSGNPIPVYTELQVQAFARAYTGWTYATSTGGVPGSFPNNTANYDSPMQNVPSAHDLTSKVLLNGTVLPGGQSGPQDLTAALHNLFEHPNVGPFVCRQLIQHLVASNPSPAYVARVSAVFANDGTGVRGNLKAVVNAILMDQDARAGDTSANFDGGHLREPMLWMTDILRGLGFVSNSSTGDYSSLSNYTFPLGERPYGSGSVFNFFPPNYVIPGTTNNAPEFANENTASAVLRLTLADNIVYNRISGFTANLTATGTLGQMASNPGNLVDALGMIFMHGQMPAPMRSAIVNNITPLTDNGQRVRVATYLVITASQYKLEH